MKEKNWVALHAKMDILKTGLDTYFELKRQSRWFFSKEYLRNWWHKWGNPWNRGALPTYKAGFEKQQKRFWNKWLPKIKFEWKWIHKVKNKCKNVKENLFEVLFTPNQKMTCHWMIKFKNCCCKNESKFNSFNFSYCVSKLD